MSARTPSLAVVEHKLLARFPQRTSDPVRMAEFADSFGESCINAADAVVLMVDVMKPDDLAAYAERLSGIVVDAIETAAAWVDVSGSPWVHQGQRWAVETFFARIAEVRSVMARGGQA